RSVSSAAPSAWVARQPKFWTKNLPTCSIIVGQTSRSVRMGLQPTNRYENPAVGQALGLRRPLRPLSRAFNNLRWVFERARVPLDPLSRSKSRGFRQPRQADEASAAVQGDRPQLMQVLIPRANLRTQPSPAGKRARSSKRELRHASFSRIAIGTRSGAASASGGMIG